MNAFTRPAPHQVSIRAQITWLREQMQRDDKRLKALMQRGQIKPESVDYHQRHQRALLATLQAQELTEYGTSRTA